MILPKTREEFEYWLQQMESNRADFFLRYSHLEELLDFSIMSLDFIELLLLNKYAGIDPHQLQKSTDSEDKIILSFCIFYIGETYRKHLDGKWDFAIFSKKEMTVGHEHPVIIRRNYEYVHTSYSVIVPSNLLWTCIHRQDGHFLSRILNVNINSFEKWNEQFKEL